MKEQASHGEAESASVSLRRAGRTEGVAVGGAKGGAQGGTGCVRAAVVADRAGPGAVVAFEHGRVEVRVAAGVLHQVVTAHEPLVTEWAAKLFLPSVGAVVSGQFIGAGKLLTAVWPRTGKRPLTCVCP